MRSRMPLSRPATAARSSGVSDRSRQVLWARAAGRCQYRGCNVSLIGDLTAGVEDRTFGFVAHIVAAQPTGPRGNVARSPRLVDVVDNLMLLCHTHHKLIDVDGVSDHPEERLLLMKREHETRVDIVCGIDDDRASHVLCYAADIGAHTSPIPYADVKAAMLPRRFPAEGVRTLDLRLQGLEQRGSDPEFWTVQRDALRRQFAVRVKSRIEDGSVRHLSVFARAPQPLLIELGRLLGDITPAEVYQLHREPAGWRWAEDRDPIQYRVRHGRGDGPAALVLALSATVNDERIHEVLGPNAAIWAIAADAPHNDVMRHVSDLAAFRSRLRSLLDALKAHHGQHGDIHLFPVLPVSAAVEVGRIWMPQADRSLIVYDQQPGLPFVRTLQVA